MRNDVVDRPIRFQGRSRPLSTRQVDCDQGTHEKLLLQRLTSPTRTEPDERVAAFRISAQPSERHIWALIGRKRDNMQARFPPEGRSQLNTLSVGTALAD